LTSELVEQPARPLKPTVRFWPLADAAQIAVCGLAGGYGKLVGTLSSEPNSPVIAIKSPVSAE
jgi:hypothetical protein